MPPPSARDLGVGDARDLALVLLRPPARERQVRVAVDEAGEHRAAGASSVTSASASSTMRPSAVATSPGSSESARGLAQVRRPGRHAQHLRRAAQRERRHRGMGIRTPSRSAALMASS